MFPMEKTPVEEEENEMDNGKDEDDDDDEGEVEMEEALNEERKVQKLTIRVVYDHKHKESGKASSTSSSSCFSSWSCCCQADECGVDLSMAKKYNQRHKVCERHSKAPVVLVSSIRQRFCQQCSKFHELAQFDDTEVAGKDWLVITNVEEKPTQLQNYILGVKSSQPHAAISSD